ncbi:MAG: triose-phosphate isomerase [Ignavibacteria bacterium]|nr:triose-phosphate isomerase [Ignavibacteria bacterium]
MNRKLIAGNWKMNLNVKESVHLAKTVAAGVSNLKDPNADVLICPAFLSLEQCGKTLKDSPVMLGAQDVCANDEGAYTGEISSAMLLSAGCEFVIIGHSERRKYYCETNETVNLKVKKALERGLKPVMCVGETLQERQDEIFEAIVGEQITEGLKEVSEDQLNFVTIAYEPVWAIGTGVNATPKQASDMHLFIRRKLSQLCSSGTAEAVRILYGGSVNAKNAKEILAAKGIDGALVGGASLKAEDFLTIISAC